MAKRARHDLETLFLDRSGKLEATECLFRLARKLSRLTRHDDDTEEKEEKRTRITKQGHTHLYILRDKDPGRRGMMLQTVNEPRDPTAGPR